MNQQDYNNLVDALDKVFDVFKAMGKSDAQAEAAMRSFVMNHYFKVWRAMK